jgi:hypothetical protein
MGIALCHFKWTAHQFIHATPHEFWAAFEVLREFHNPPTE